MPAHRPYRGRFAPSPTGPLHAGSLVAALASWLDARAHHGTWLVRLEDVDTPRCPPGTADHILHQLAACGLVSDGPVWVQSTRNAAYEAALATLQTRQLAYACACTRKDIEQALHSSGHTRPRHAELRYPGTCRPGTHGQPGRAWRLLTEFSYKLFMPPALSAQAWAAPFFETTTPDHLPAPGASTHTASTAATIAGASESTAEGCLSAPATTCTATGTTCHWFDRWAGWQHQNVAEQVGDFVLKRADGLWAYQLAVVVDDAAQGITHVVRGTDLTDNTPRQLLLQRALGLPHPQYLHTPLVLGADGHKLSKQNGAAALDLSNPLAALNAAAVALGLPEWVGNGHTGPTPLGTPDAAAQSVQSAHTAQAIQAALADWVPWWAARWAA